MNRVPPIAWAPRLAWTLLLAASLTGCGQSEASSPTASKAPSDPWTLLEQAEAAYQAGSFHDQVTIQFVTNSQPSDKRLIEMTFGDGTDAHVKMSGLEIVTLDGSMYLTRGDVPSKYLQVPLEGDVLTTMKSVFNGQAGLPLSAMLRLGEGQAAYLESLSLGLLTNPTLGAVTTTPLPDGGSAHVIELKGSNGSGRVLFDATSHFVRLIEVEAEPAGAEAPMTVQGTIAFDGTSVDDPDIAFAASGTRVEALAALVNTPIQAGMPAPEFTLETNTGETVTLADLRGSVVVLDFWATWCMPCRRGLPLLQKFHEWTETSDQNVVVFGVDVFERGATAQKRKQAETFWNGQKFTMPTLFDLDDRVVNSYGIQSIPTTVVIGPDGVVAKVHRGFDPNTVASLQRDVATILAQGE